MTVGKALDNIQKTKDNESYFNIWDIAETEFAFYGDNFNEPDDKRLKIYFLHKWYCTDSWVGYRAYFLDDVLIAVTYQCGRKFDQEFHYTWKNSSEKLKDYIKSFMVEEREADCNVITEDFYNQEMDN